MISGFYLSANPTYHKYVAMYGTVSLSLDLRSVEYKLRCPCNNVQSLWHKNIAGFTRMHLCISDVCVCMNA